MATGRPLLEHPFCISHTTKNQGRENKKNEGRSVFFEFASFATSFAHCAQARKLPESAYMISLMFLAICEKNPKQT
jgi:hypothetical protein